MARCAGGLGSARPGCYTAPMRRSQSAPSRFAHALVLCALVAAVGCKNGTGAGDRCVTRDDCPNDLECIRFEASSELRCLAPCDPSTTVLCDEDTHDSQGLCQPIESDSIAGVCLLAGTTEDGDNCDSSAECMQPGICIEVAADAECYRACDTDRGNDDCEGDDVCTAVTGGAAGRGYCFDPPAD